MMSESSGTLILHILRAFEVDIQDLEESILWLLYSIDQSKTKVVFDSELYYRFIIPSTKRGQTTPAQKGIMHHENMLLLL